MYEWGYEQNTCEPCTFNKIVNSKKLTIQCYFDDLKCLHLEQSVLDNLVRELNNVLHMSNKELAETKGDVNKYLGLAIDSGSRYNGNNPDKKG